jgi:hypothetical protein
VNSDGDVAGSFDPLYRGADTGPRGQLVPVLWEAQPPNTSQFSVYPTSLLPPLDPLAGRATDLNESGRITGAVGNQIAIWDAPSQTPSLLPGVFGSFTFPRINNLGEIAFATSDQPPNLNRLKLWSGGQLFDLGAAERVHDLNDSGDVLFANDPLGGAYQFTLLEGDEITPLPIRANAVNDLGVVVGYFGTIVDAIPAKWKRSTGAVALPTPLAPNPPGYHVISTTGMANAINNRGEIVGEITWGFERNVPIPGAPDNTIYETHAMLWTASGATKDLNYWRPVNYQVCLESATAIGDTGVVTARGDYVPQWVTTPTRPFPCLGGFYPNAFRLTPQH